MEKENQKINIQLSPTGELKFKGDITTPEQFEVYQQTLDESHRRSRDYQKIQEITKVETTIQGFIFIGAFTLTLFTISYVAVRQISSLFQPTQEVTSNAR